MKIVSAIIGAACTGQLQQLSCVLSQGRIDQNGILKPAQDFSTVQCKTFNGMGGSSGGTVSAVAAIANGADTDSGINIASGSESEDFNNPRIHYKTMAGIAGGSSGGLGNVPAKIENNNPAELTDNIELAALSATNNQYSGVTDVMRQ